MMGEDWQTKLPTIRERNQQMFNNSLLSDVKFIFQEENGEVKTIPAHKYVLAISSPVFFSMFNNEFTEKNGNVEIADSDSASFLAMLNYIYCDYVCIGDCQQALTVWYLASKYFIPSLSEKCVSFLISNVGVNDVLEVVAFAFKFQEKALLETCLKIIDFRVKTILYSPAFEELDRMILIEIFKRDNLRTNEIALVKSLDRWAQRKCELTNAEKTPEIKRQIIGEDLFSLIRFPASDQKEFAQEVLPLNLLTNQEVIDIFKHFSSVQVQNMVFPITPRKNYPKLVFLNRYSSVSYGWTNTRKSAELNSFTMSVNKPVLLCGFSIFGSQNAEYAVDLEVSEKDSPSMVIAKCKGTFTTNRNCSISDVSARVFNCLFDQTPVLLKRNNDYLVKATIIGPDSYFGNCYMSRVVTNDLINVSFQFQRINGCEGQVPRVIIMAQ